MLHIRAAPFLRSGTCGSSVDLLEPSGDVRTVRKLGRGIGVGGGTPIAHRGGAFVGDLPA